MALGNPICRGMRLLLADDSMIVTHVVERHFQSKGWTVDTVHDGLEALEAAQAGGYDLIFLDQMMPTMLGAEVLQSIREFDADTPIIMISALDDEATMVRCFAMGANDVLHKPIDTKDLDLRSSVHLPHPEAQA